MGRVGALFRQLPDPILGRASHRVAVQFEWWCMVVAGAHLGASERPRQLVRSPMARPSAARHGDVISSPVQTSPALDPIKGSSGRCRALGGGEAFSEEGGAEIINSVRLDHGPALSGLGQRHSGMMTPPEHHSSILPRRNSGMAVRRNGGGAGGVRGHLGLGREVLQVLRRGLTSPRRRTVRSANGIWRSAVNVGCEW